MISIQYPYNYEQNPAVKACIIYLEKNFCKHTTTKMVTFNFLSVTNFVNYQATRHNIHMWVGRFTDSSQDKKYGYQMHQIMLMIDES